MNSSPLEVLVATKGGCVSVPAQRPTGLAAAGSVTGGGPNLIGKYKLLFCSQATAEREARGGKRKGNIFNTLNAFHKYPSVYCSKPTIVREGEHFHE